MNFIYLPACDS